MKSIEEIKDEVAQEHNNSSWSDMMFKYGGVGDTIIDKVVHRYAREVAQASLEKAAEVVSRNYNDSYECKQDIINQKNITLL